MKKYSAQAYSNKCSLSVYTSKSN